MSCSEALADFIAAMEVEGVRAIEPIASRLSSCDLIRFRCDGDGRGRQNGWAILYLDERPAGAFGNYRLGISRKWIAGDHRTLSAQERDALRREWAAAKQRRLDERSASEAEAARDALDIWAASAPADAAHGYVVRKGLDTARLRQSGDKLVIPMMDGAGALWNLQRIGKDGAKRFLRGGRTQGLFSMIGQFDRRAQIACIGEGYSTMQAVHRHTGYAAIVAFSAKNLGAVARLWADRRPDLQYIICADDDAHLPRNIGVEAAEAAAREIRAKVALPRATAS